MDLDENHLDRIANISFQPIFILGFHRSGTSILYKLLSETKCFNTVTAYNIIKYEELLYNHLSKKEKKVKESLNNFIKKQGKTDRGIDELKVSADFNEEYRFLFINHRYKPWINKYNLSLFIKLCKKIQFISENNKPILLKNPSDFSNFLFIQKTFPNAKFIFIHRNPINMLNSNIRSINDLFIKKNYYTAILSRDYNKIAKNPFFFNLSKFYFSSSTLFRTYQMIRRAVKNMDYYLKNISSLDNKSYVYIRYEDLCEKPREEILKVMNFLDLESKVKINYNKKINPRKNSLIKELQILQPYTLKKMKNYLSYIKDNNIFK